MHAVRLLVVLASLLSLAGCTCSGDEASSSGDGAASVSLALNWFPEAEHGGFYAADVHGFYAAEGVEVRIQAGRPEAPVLTQVAAGRVDFGVDDASGVLLARAEGVPVVVVLASLQHNPRCILVRSDSPFQRLGDLRDIELAMNVREPFAQILRQRVPLEGVTVVPYAGNVAPFLANEAYAQQAYVFSEPFVAQAEGVNVRCLMTAELGFDPYASVLVTSETMIASDPERVGKVVRAVAQGWGRYLEDPAETNAHIHELNPEMAMELLEQGATAVRVLAGPAADVGSMSADRWTALRDSMAGAELVPADLDVSSAFTTRFLPE